MWSRQNHWVQFLVQGWLTYRKKSLFRRWYASGGVIWWEVTAGFKPCQKLAGPLGLDVAQWQVTAAVVVVMSKPQGSTFCFGITFWITKNLFTTSGLGCLCWALDWTPGKQNSFTRISFYEIWTGLPALGSGLGSGEAEFFLRELFYENWTGNEAWAGLGGKLQGNWNFASEIFFKRDLSYPIQIRLYWNV